jgi:hypothetical protein
MDGQTWVSHYGDLITLSAYCGCPSKTGKFIKLRVLGLLQCAESVLQYSYRVRDRRSRDVNGL